MKIVDPQSLFTRFAYGVKFFTPKPLTDILRGLFTFLKSLFAASRKREKQATFDLKSDQGRPKF